MSEDTLLPIDLPSVAHKKVSVGFDGGQRRHRPTRLTRRARLAKSRAERSHLRYFG
jgi:hypothetical protein